MQDYDIVPGEPEPALESVPLLAETVFLAVAGGGPDGAGRAARGRAGAGGRPRR